jgi:hypothetical protein
MTQINRGHHSLLILKLNCGKVKKKKDYLIRVYYCGKQIKLPQCKHNHCNLDEFIQIIDKHQTDQSEFNNLCSKTFKSEL